MNEKIKTTISEPYHFVLLQHGVLGQATDFEGIVSELIVEHDVSVAETLEAAQQQNLRALQRNTTTTTTATTTTTTTTTVLCSPTLTRSGARGNHPFPPSQQQPQLLSAVDSAAQMRARRATYRSQFTLSTTCGESGGRVYQSGHLTCFSAGSNNLLRTDSGTECCAMRLLKEFLPVFTAWLTNIEAVETSRWKKSQGRTAAAAAASTEEGGASFFPSGAEAPPLLTPAVCFSCVGHSFGGIILREFLFWLLTDTEELPRSDPVLYVSVMNVRALISRLHVSLENFITLATPHCGAAECLWWPIYAGAWCLARMKLWKTFSELIITDPAQLMTRRLVDDKHLDALAAFRHRTLFANTHRDLLVGFGTGSLIFEGVPDDHTKVIGLGPQEVPCAPAFDTDASEVSDAIYLPPYRGTEVELFQYRDGNNNNNNNNTKCKEATSTRAKAAKVEVTTATSVEEVGDDNTTMMDAIEKSVRDAQCAMHARSVSSQSLVEDTHTRRGTERGAFASQQYDMSGGVSSPASTPVSDSITCGSMPTLSETKRGARELRHNIESNSTISPATSVASMNGCTHAHSATSSCTVVVPGSPRCQQFTIQEVVSCAQVATTRASTQTISSLTNEASSPHAAAAPLVVSVELPVWSRFAAALSVFPTSGFSTGKSDNDDDTTQRAVQLQKQQKWPCGVLGWARRAINKVYKCLPRIRSLPADAHTAEYEVTRRMDKKPEPSHGDVDEMEEDNNVVPRYIAFRLRQRLDWRVRAVRYNNRIPTAHVACLGNWTWAGTSPAIVTAIAEEIANILI